MAQRRVLSLVIGLKDEASKRMAKLGKAVAAFTAAGLAVGLRFAKQSIDAFTVQEDALNAINASLRVTNQLTDEALEMITTRAAEIQKITKQGDEAIIRATATVGLLAKELSAPELALAQEALVGIADTFFKGDLESAALIVGKSIGSATNALTRYGIAVDVGGTQSEKLAQIMDQSNGFFQVAIERATTLSGRMTQASNAWGDFKEKIGEVLQDRTAAKSFFFELTNIVGNLTTALSGSTDDIRLAFELVGQIAGQAFMSAYLEALAAGFRLLVPDFIEKGLGKVGLVSFPEATAAGLEAFAADAIANASEAVNLLAQLAKNVARAQAGGGGGSGGGGDEPPAQGIGVRRSPQGQFGAGTFGLGLPSMFGGGGLGGGGASGLFSGGIPFAPSEESLSTWERFRGFVGEVGEGIKGVTENQEALADVTGGILLSSIQNFGSAWVSAVQSAVQGTKTLGDAFKSAMLGAIGSVARGFGDLYSARAVAAFAAGNFASGGLFTAAAGAMYTLAGVAGAFAGGGAGAAGSVATDTAGSLSGEATIVIQGGILDTNDQRQMDALARALGNVSGLRRVSIQGGLG